MESDNQREDSSQQPDDKTSNITPKPEFEDGPNITSNQDESSNKEEHRGKVNKWKEYSKKWSEPLVIITAILAFATFLLYWRATQDSKTAEESSKAAKISAEAAVNAVKEQKRNDSVSHLAMQQSMFLESMNNAKKYKSDSINNANNFNISSNTLKTQINSLKQSQKDFESENRPILTITDISIDTTYPMNNVNISFKINNIGKFPARDISFRTKIVFGKDTLNILNDALWVSIKTSDYLGGNFSIPATRNIGNLNPILMRIIKNMATNIYIFFDYSYQNTVLKKKYFSYIGYQISYEPDINIIAVVNKEWDG